MRSTHNSTPINTHSTTINQANNLVLQSKEKHFNIWSNPSLHKTYEEHTLSSFTLEDLQLYQQRKSRSDEWIGIYYVSVKNQKESKQSLHVFTERIVMRIDQIQEMTFADGMIVLKEVLVGFRSIYSRFGGVHVSQKMIGVNQERRIKVWRNQEYWKNNIENEFNVDQKEVVTRIFQLMEKKIASSQQFRKYKSEKETKLKLLEFEPSILFLKQYLKQNEIQQSLKLNMHQLKLTKPNVPKLKFQRKTFMKRNNRHKLTILTKNIQTKQNQIQKTFHKTRSVKYFKSPSSETRSRSGSIFSEKLSFSTRSRARAGSLTNSANGFQLLSPKSLLASQKLKAQFKTLKSSQSIVNNLKSKSPNYHELFPKAPQQATFSNSIRSELNIKFIKQSVILNQEFGQSSGFSSTNISRPNSNKQLFKDLKQFHSIKNLKKSQYFQKPVTYSPPADSLFQSFPRSDSVLAKSFYNTNIKEIIEEEYD